MLKKLTAFVIKRKILSGVVLVVIAVLGYAGYHAWAGNAVETRYVTATVQKGTLVTSVTGSGQISVSNQVDVKPKASGDVVSVAVKNGQEVKAGALIAQLNARDALKAVRDAQANWASAKLALDKVRQPAGASSVLQAENALATARASLEKLKLQQQTDQEQATESKQNAEDDLVKTYEDTFNAVSDAFLDLPDIMGTLHDVLYGTDIGTSESSLSSGQSNESNLINSVASQYRDALTTSQMAADSDYATARAAYDDALADYTAANRSSDPATIEALLTKTLGTVRVIAQSAKSENNFLGSWTDDRTQAGSSVFSKVTSYQGDLATDISQANSHLSSLLTVQRTLKDDRETITNADRTLTELAQNGPLDLAAAEATVKEREASLADLKAGAAAIDVRSQELSLQQRSNALLDAREKLADYSVRAPFDGIVAKVDAKKGDPVSASTVIATMITKQSIAQIALNEVDAAKIAVGQKATLTFDAVDGLNISGEVGDLDTLGTVSQGVVTYTATILFDTQDDRIKPGMSVSAAIITDVRQDVLIIPNSAVKTQGSLHTVDVFDPPLADAQGNQGVASPTPPRSQSVEIGLSNDTSTEIISGLTEGEQIVVRTVTSSAKPATAQAPSLFGAAGGNRAGGGAPAGGAARITR